MTRLQLAGARADNNPEGAMLHPHLDRWNVNADGEMTQYRRW